MIKLEIDKHPKPFGIIAGAVMTRVAASPIDEAMAKLESPEVGMDWFPIGTDSTRGEAWLLFAIAIEDISLWVEYLSEQPKDESTK